IMILSAFLLGFAGSLHCVGMCGPLVILLEKKTSANAWFQLRLPYHLGKLFTYTSMGIIAGLIGSAINLSGFQQIVSITIGTLMILLVIYYALQKRTVHLPQFGNFSFINKATGKVLNKKGPFNNLIFGMLNGLLPCGLVYMALMSSVTTSSIAEGALYMLVFGLATIPALLIIGIGSKMLKVNLSYNKILPIVLFLVGILLILRGLNLGIPFISPSMEMDHSMHSM
ncbi:MAG: sulfite exporter TauE/SafE family protein, partial [Cyclobacteriaceae bacterium]|nr:sulfite exporter TauE/SafE family protein [Cyclobacteriaceae bacterium]